MDKWLEWINWSYEAGVYTVALARLHWIVVFGGVLFGIALLWMLRALSASQIIQRHFRTERFEKRSTIYRQLVGFLDLAQRNQLTEENIELFSLAIQNAYFLFNPTVFAYLKEVREKAIELRRLQQELSNPFFREVEQNRRQINQLLHWFEQEARSSWSKFDAYLRR